MEVPPSCVERNIWELFVQYLAAFKHAALRKPCELYLTPLGGGVFGNDTVDIAGAMALAYDHITRISGMKGALDGVDVRLLTYDRNKSDRTEANKFAGALAGRAP